MTHALRKHERDYLAECVIVIDTREQTPWVFPNNYTRRGTIGTGDYSIEGPDGRSFLPGNGTDFSIALERKALGDLAACLTFERERFEAELKRARDGIPEKYIPPVKYFAVLVEAKHEDILIHKYNADITTTAFVESINTFEIRYNIPFHLMGNPGIAARWARSLLFKYVRELIITGKIVVPGEWF